MGDGQWYWCLRHHQVEPYRGCRSADRLGPYPSPSDASEARERVQQRNEEWEADPRWNEEEEE